MSPRRRAVIALGWAAVGVIALMIVARVIGPTYGVAGDAHYVLATARSLAFDGDLDLTNQYQVMGDRWGLGRDPALDGWRLPAREIGSALLMVPGLLLHHLLRIDPAWEPTFAGLLAAASLAGLWLACVAILEALDDRRGTGLADRSRPWLAAVIVLGGVVPYYAIGRSGYTHAPDALACAWLTWALVARRGPVLVGTLLACTVLIRMQNGLWLIWPMAELVAAGREDRRRELGRVAGIVAIGLLGVCPQAWLALAHPGSVHGAIRWELGFFDVHELGADLLRVLFGVHGLVRWTPLAGLAVIGLAWAAFRSDVARRALLVIAGMVLLCAMVRDVDGGDAFGARRLAGIVGLLAIGLASLHDRLIDRLASGPRRAMIGAMIGASVVAVAINLGLVGLAIAGRISLASPSGQAPDHSDANSG